MSLGSLSVETYTPFDEYVRQRDATIQNAQVQKEGIVKHSYPIPLCPSCGAPLIFQSVPPPGNRRFNPPVHQCKNHMHQGRKLHYQAFFPDGRPLKRGPVSG